VRIVRSSCTGHNEPAACGESGEIDGISQAHFSHLAAELFRCSETGSKPKHGDWVYSVAMPGAK